MKCFICGGAINTKEQTVQDHIQNDINDNQYGMRANTLAAILININDRITDLERARYAKGEKREIKIAGKEELNSSELRRASSRS